MNNLINIEFDGIPNTFIEGNVAKFDYPCSTTLECSPYKVFFLPGKYKFELYGAQGGNGRYQNLDLIREDSGGKGAYVSGVLNLFYEATFYFFIGGKGEDQADIKTGAFGRGGYNGGGNGGADTSDKKTPESNAGGGGSTDIRLINSQSFKGLKSRIIVAAGGGSAVSANATAYGGSGGCLEGKAPTDNVIPGNQSSGSFWKGQDGVSIGSVNNGTFTFGGGSTGGGGGGYYGGTTLSYDELPLKIKYVESGGAGGSSFISGFHGCNAVQYDREETSVITHTGRSIHYSGYRFKKSIMKDGDTQFNKPGSNELEKGHSGNGSIVVTYIGPTDTCSNTERAGKSLTKCFLHKNILKS